MSQRTETQMVPRQTVMSTTCDNCGKTENGEPDGWVHFGTGHGDWGNDSVDSWRYFDACSADCFLALMRKRLDEYGEPGPHPSFSVSIDGFDYGFARSLIAEVVPKALADELARKALVYADEPEKGSGVFLREVVARYREATALSDESDSEC